MIRIEDLEAGLSGLSLMFYLHSDPNHFSYALDILQYFFPRCTAKRNSKALVKHERFAVDKQMSPSYFFLQRWRQFILKQ